MTEEKIPWWRDERVLRVLGQAVFVLLVLMALAFLGHNLVVNFQQLGLQFGFGFLSRPASFALGDAAIEYSPADSYSRAILVGLLNSLQVMVSGILLATILGVSVGIGRLSDNWLVRQIATVYVETIRNTPLLLQLFCWYFAVFLKFPPVDKPAIAPGPIFLSKRGVDLPFPASSQQTWLSLAFIVLSLILAAVLWRRQTQMREQRGEPAKVYSLLLAGVAIATLLAFLLGLDWQQPQLNSATQQIQGGINLSPEFASLLIGLTVYTAAFIAEHVRSGIQSVNQGQWEAARALGLNPTLVMRLVIFPQALRVMIPSLTSEYLNLAKNSSLALAIGYSDIYAISNTISNQTGRALEMLVVVMGTYLLINLIISVGMNKLNSFMNYEL